MPPFAVTSVFVLLNSGFDGEGQNTDARDQVWIANVLVAVCCGDPESVALISTELYATLAGFPLIPPLALKTRPSGNVVSFANLNAIVPVPPDELSANGLLF